MTMSAKEVAGLCNEWACWVQALDGSGLGYPSMSAEARAQAGGRRSPGPIVPRLVMNSTCSLIDQAVRTMPHELGALIRHKHLTGEGTARDKVQEYCARFACCPRSYYSREREAYAFIGGYLTAVTKCA